MMNTPGTPITAVSAGPAISDTANVAPMVMPMAAMARVRTESRVRSAVNAITAAEMAPAPWMVRPTITHAMVGAHAATKLPSANSSRPKMITGLRPQWSDAQPNGICRIAWVRP